MVSVDEGPTVASVEKIPQLRPAFRKDGTVTAASSSSISDGAASLVLMSASDAAARGIKPLARIAGHSGFAHEPEWFTTAPVFAIGALHDKLGWNGDSVDLYEINEAFACVTMAAMQDIGIDHDKVNVNGGACALGHPIGASGARIIVTLIHALKNRGGGTGLRRCASAAEKRSPSASKSTNTPENNMDMQSAKAVVTGAASEHGLGYATARRVIDAGGYAALLDVNDEQGEASAAGLGERAIYIHTDVSSESAVRSAIAKAADFMGGITLAVNCAGIIGAARALGREAPMPGEFFENTIKVNLVGSFLVAKEAANVMQHNEPNGDGERGLIVSTASIAAFEGQIGQVAYAASKGGVVGMTLPLAREFARIGIRVNVIAPGIFMTPMVAGMTPELQESLGAQVPFPSRLGRPEEYAALVASIYENAMINGETIRIDGAIRMQPK